MTAEPKAAVFSLRSSLFECEIQELERRAHMLERYPINAFQQRLTAGQRDRYLAASKRIYDLLHEQIGADYATA